MTDLILKQNFLSNQLNYMKQLHAGLTKKDSKDIKDLAAKSNIQHDIDLLEPLYQETSHAIVLALESQLPEGKNFRFLPSARKPKMNVEK